MKCQACGIPPGADCLGERFPRLCVLVACGEPGIAARLRELADVAPLPHPSSFAPRPSEGPVRTCILGPVLYTGGAERWAATLIRYCDPARVRWLGVGATGDAHLNSAMVAELQSLCPVAVGPAACAALAARCEVVISWGLADVARYISCSDATFRVAAPQRPLLIATSHGDRTSQWTRNVMAGSCPPSDAVVAVSREALGPIPEPWRAQATVIFNGVDRRRLVPRLGRDAQRAAWGVGRDAQVLGYLGRLSYEKDPYAVAKAVACLPEPWVGVLVGDGLDAQAVVAHARATAPGRIAFPGVTRDIGSALAAFDALLIPSLEDGFSLTMIEGMSMGVPIVCTPVGGWHEHPNLVRTVAIGADGRTVAAAVLADQADSVGTRERCRMARQVARERYGAECFAAQWSTLLWRLARAETLVATG